MTALRQHVDLLLFIFNLLSLFEVCLVLYPEVKELGVCWIDRFAVLDDVAAKDLVITWRVSVAHSGIPPF